MALKKSTAKILTLHPEGKKGVNISLDKYNQVRVVLKDLIKKHKQITFDQLTDLAEAELNRQSFDGKPLWYIVTVKLDLEARGEIERIRGVKQQTLRQKIH